MELEASHLAQGGGLGSWHPAMRPDSQYATQESKKQAEGNNIDYSLTGAQARLSIPQEVPIPDLHSATPQHVPPLSIENDSHDDPCRRDASLDLLKNEHPAPALNNVLEPENGGSGREDTTTRLQSLGVKKSMGPVREDSLPPHFQCDGEDAYDSLRLPYPADNANSDSEPTGPTQSGSDNIEEVKELDTIKKRGQPRSLLADFGTISRTNSFPEVPPLRRPESPLAHLAHSQAQDIIEEDGALVDLGSGEASITDEGKKISNPFDPTADGNESRFFVNSGGLHPEVGSPPDEEARFEEGLPLMPSGSNADQSTDGLSDFYEKHVSSPGLPEVSNDGYPAESEDTLPDEPSFFRPQPLDRKSTGQVLNSLNHVSNGFELEVSGQDNPKHTHQESGESTTLESTAVHEAGDHDPGNTGESSAKIDFFGQDPKDDDLAAMWQAALGDDELLDENEPFVDPVVFFDDDGEGFLEENQDSFTDQLQSQQTASSGNMPQEFIDSNAGNRNGTISQQQYTPAPYTQPSTLLKPPYFPGADPTQQLPQATFGTNHFLSAPAGFNIAPHQQPPIGNAPSSTRPRMPQSTQSFADKSKGGYTSPYDLPMDVTRPKKRNYTQQIQTGANAQTPTNNSAPPRSSSMYTKGSPVVDNPPPLPNVVGVSVPPPVGNARPPALGRKASFFEELPSVKPRPSSGIGRVAHVHQTNPPRQVPPQYGQSVPNLVRSASSSSGISQAYQLLPPERMGPYAANASSQESSTQAVPALNSRYSPAPASQQTVPPPRNRYASSPVSGPRPQSAQILPFQPRTSSPLAIQNASAVQQQSRQESVMGNPPPPVIQQEPVAQELAQPPQSNRPLPLSTDSRYTPSSNSPSSSSYPIPSSSLPYNPGQDPLGSIPDAANIRPPRRSQTQSPSALRLRQDLTPNVKVSYRRPASINQTSYVDEAPTVPAATYQEDRRRNPLPPVVDYIRPSDGRENDYLERWKGCPIFYFGFGGTIVSIFPKQIPRYAVGQSTPLIKCSPGEVKIHTSEAFSLEENITTFPGPLRSKSKKKEVLDWLQKRILELENAQLPTVQISTLPDPRKRHEEKILLWRVILTFVEHDGTIEGNPTAEKAVRTILSPELAIGDDAALLSYGSNAPLLGISKSNASLGVSAAVDSENLEGLRKILLHGEREKAVWHAVDRRLWGHAMLLASTLDKGIWKQVLQEFNSQEVKAYGDNTESLAALYQIFAGNWEESVDQLVPPSARAGLQMVSKASTAGPMKNALDGLDRWRETLTLVLSNRTQDDGNALVALGRLVAGYGRTEAAHVCYIFAKTPGLFGGPDDPQVSVALLGADHLQQPYDYSRDFDSILLTEVYDFARTVLAQSPIVTVSPHLQAYKLYHALTLTEYGYRSEAQSYCDSITSALKSTTKLSPYYHSLLFGVLDDLVQRLRQAPKDGSTSMIAGLSMDKVSGSVWSRLNQFIAGEESDGGSTTSGNVHDPAAGPFARIAGDSPNISRPPSSNDLYGSYAPMGAVPSPLPTTVASNSRYAPAGQYTPRSSLEQPARSLQEFQRTAQSEVLRPPFNQQRNSLARSRSASTKSVQRQQQHDLYKPPSQPSMYTPPAESYLPTSPQPQSVPTAPPDDPPSLYPEEPYQASHSSEPKPFQESHPLNQESHSHTTYTPLDSNENPLTLSYSHEQSTYEPPSSYGYEPPSYDPQTQDGGESPEEKSLKKKKSFMYGDDDDEDFAVKAAAVLKAQKAQKDREADDAFKRAAEADGTSFHLPVLHLTPLTNPKHRKGLRLIPKSLGSVVGLVGRKNRMISTNLQATLPLKPS